MPSIPLNLAVEDAVSEAVARRLMAESGQNYATTVVYNRGGYGYLKSTVRGFNHAAKGTPYFVLTDLDKIECPPALIKEWLNAPRHRNLVLRVAVKEIEAWILADRAGFAKYLGVKLDLVPQDSETIPDPKKTLVKLACRSPHRDIKRDICPPRGSVRIVGPNYNARLIAFVLGDWNPHAASQNNTSLRKTMHRLAEFEPFWPSVSEN